MHTRKIILIVIFFIYFINLLSASSIEISNNFIKIITHAESGKFIIKTTGGDPELDSDNDTLLLGDKALPSSFTTIKINNKNYIFGDLQGRLEHIPDKKAQAIVSTWSIHNINIIQKLQLIKGKASENMDTVEISYKITNRSLKKQKIGMRIVFDTYLGNEDGASFQIPGIGLVKTEKILQGSGIPIFWYSCDDPIKPRVHSQGTLKIENSLNPDKIILAGYHRFKKYLWDFSVKEEKNFKKLFFYPNDSAMGIYWEPRQIKPKEAIAFKTYYGLCGSTVTNNKSFNLFLRGEIATLGEPFLVNADMQNISPNKMKDTKAQIILPKGLKLQNNDKDIKIIGLLKSKEIKRASWNIIPDMTVLAKIAYKINISGISKNKKYTFKVKRIIDVSSEEKEKREREKEEREREKEKIIAELKKYVKNVKVKKVAEGVIIEFGDVYFKYKSSLLTKEAKSQLNSIGKALQIYKKYSLRVEGYTDNVGSSDYNLKLSHNRAKNVWNFLVYGKYVNPEQAVFQGLGKENPIADNKTEEGRNKNRRVDIIIIPELSDK